MADQPGKKPQRPLRHQVELALYLAAESAVRLLPHALVRRLGSGLGRLIYFVDPHHRRVVAGNLERVFPDSDPRRRRQTARRCFAHWGASLLDAVSLSRFDVEEVRSRIDLEGLENLELARERGQVLMILSAHFGNWEIIGFGLPPFCDPFHVVVRPFNNPLIYRRMERERARFGYHAIHKRGAARQIFRAIKQRAAVGIVIDQRVHPSEGILVPFLGSDAWTTPMPATLSLRYGVPAIPVFGHPAPGGRYRLVIHPPLFPPEGASGKAEVAAMARRFNAAVEATILACPEQWLWLHERWRGADEAEPSATGAD